MGFLADKLEVEDKNESLLKIVYFSHISNGMLAILTGALLPFIKAEFNLSYVVSGATISAHQIGALTAVFLVAILPNLIGLKKTNLMLCFGVILGFLLMTLTANPLLLILSYALAGIGRGARNNISNVVVADISRKRTAALNILHAAFAVGAFVAPFLVIFITQALSLNWRLAAWFLILFESTALLFVSRSTMSDVPVKKVKTSCDHSTERSFTMSPVFWLNTVLLFFYLCSEASIIGWLVTWFKESGRLSNSLAQSTASLLWIMILLGRLACAWLSTRMSRNLMLLVMAAAQLFFFTLMILTQNVVLLYVGLLGTGLAMSGFYPTVLGTMPRQFTSSTLATGTCIGVSSLGAIFTPIIVGYVAEKTGITGGISVIAVALCCSVVIAIIKFAGSKKSL